MKFIHTADGPAPTQAEIMFFEQAAHKLALGMQEGTTRRSFETIGGTSAYLVVGTPGVVHIHTLKDDPKSSSTQTTADDSNSYGSLLTPPDFVAGFIHGDGRTRVLKDAVTGCFIPQLLIEPTAHTEYVSPEYAARKLAAVGGKVYGATTYPPEDAENATFSQSSRKRPGYFTGHMATIVQMMLGGGRFTSPSVYKLAAQQRKVKSPIGGMQLGIDARTGKVDEPPQPSHYQYMKPYEKDKCVGTANTSDPFAMEVPWDYRWHRTHGIVFGQDKTVAGSHSIGFIVDISDTGVYAYPVQVDPLTRYGNVQQYMKKVYPWLDEPVFNGMDVFEAFGGIPLPTYITQAKLNAAVTAGTAARLCDTTTFYTNGEFISTMFGWAFSESTGEAANITVKDFGEDKMKKTQLFKLKVSGLQIVEERDAQNKVRVVTKGTGGIIKVSEGSFYNPGKPPANHPCGMTEVPQFHIYEPLLGVMVTYDLRYGRSFGQRDCDAPMFCSYVKDDLHVLNYFSSAAPPTNAAEATREPCQVTGTWTETTAGGVRTAGHFYNSTTDFRRQIADFRVETTTKAWPAYDYTKHEQVVRFSQLCRSTRLYFNHVNIVQKDSGIETWHAAVGTSSTDRSVYFVCTLHTKSRGYTGYGSGIDFAGSGPEIRYCSFTHYITHWYGGDSGYPITSECMTPVDDHVEYVESCYSGATESLVGAVEHFTIVDNEGTKGCWAPDANRVHGGSYSGSGVFGEWTALGYEPRTAAAFPEPAVRTYTLQNNNTALQRIYMFGAPLAHGRMITEYSDSSAPEEDAFGLEFAHEWFKFSLPECPVVPMPVCRNFYGTDFMSTYNDRSWSEIRDFGKSPGLGPTAIPVGGIMK